MSKVKRVLQIGMTSNKGGMESYIISQYRNIDKRKIMYDFINITGELKMAYSEEILDSGGHIYSVVSRHSNPIKHYYSLFMLLYELRKKYYAIVLNACSLDYVFPLFISKLIGIPLRIMHSHNSNNETDEMWYRKALRWINGQLLKFSANKFWACSKAAGDWMFGTQKYSVIHNAIEVDKYVYNKEKREIIRRKYNVENKFVIGNVARFSKQKNHILLIRIFSELVKSNQNAELWLVGAYKYDKIIYENVKREIKKLNIDGKIVFWGERDDVADLYQAMDCLVMPSLFEGLSITAIEAQATGLLCYFSDKMSKETAITSGCHFISLQDNPQKWAQEIINNKNNCRSTKKDEIRNAGYDIKTEVRKIEEMYLEG